MEEKQDTSNDKDAVDGVVETPLDYDRKMMMYKYIIIALALFALCFGVIQNQKGNEVEAYKKEYTDIVDTMYEVECNNLMLKNQLNKLLEIVGEQAPDILETIKLEIRPEVEKILSGDGIKVDIGVLLNAFKDRESGVYADYNDKHLIVTAYVKNKDATTGKLRVDSIEMQSMFGSTVDFGDMPTEEVKEIIEGLNVGDKVEIDGIGDTSGFTFVIEECQSVVVIEQSDVILINKTEG